MKKLKKAFTLIELIVITSIIVIISLSGMLYFNDFTDKIEIKSKLSYTEDIFKSLDKRVKNYEIYDYEILINTGSLKLGFITYIDQFDLDKEQFINFNSINGSGTITTNGSNSENWNIKIYKGNKLYINENKGGDSTYLGLFNENKNYTIKGYLTGEILNNIGINYYSEDNFDSDGSNYVDLTSINTKQNRTGINIVNLKIENIGGNKKFYNNGSEISEKEIYLFFENKGKEEFIKIDKTM